MSADDEASKPRASCAEVTRDMLDGTVVEAIVISLVFALAVVLIVDDFVTSTAEPPSWWIVGIFMTISCIFFLELVLKCAVFGKKYILVAGNMGDIAVVAAAVICTAVETKLRFSSEDPLRSTHALVRMLIFAIIVMRQYRVSFFLHHIQAARQRRRQSVESTGGVEQVDSPKSSVEKVINILYALRDSPVLRGAQALQIDWVMSVVASGELYAHEAAVVSDAETRAWLQQQTAGGGIRTGSKISTNTNSIESGGEAPFLSVNRQKSAPDQAVGLGAQKSPAAVPRTPPHIDTHARHVPRRATRFVRELPPELGAPLSARAHAAAAAAKSSTRSRLRTAPSMELKWFSSLTKQATELNSEEMNAMRRSVLEWSCDIFALNAHSNGHPLCLVSGLLYSTFNFSELQVSREVYLHYMIEVESNYLTTNAYHNNIHGADVMQTLSVFLRDPTASAILCAEDVFAGCVAAAVHDLAHPGTNNNFNVVTHSEWALMYNDRAVLENMHISKAFDIMRSDPGLDLLANFDAETRAQIRETIIFMVLGTDMSKHFEHLSHFQAQVMSPNLDVMDVSVRRTVLRMALHAADISNPAKPFAVYAVWADRVMDEFFSQGDQERELGLPISPFMDRQHPQRAKCQLGFIQFIVRPLYEAWTELLSGMRSTLLETIDTNRDIWKKRQESAEAEAAAKGVASVEGGGAPRQSHKDAHHELSERDSNVEVVELPETSQDEDAKSNDVAVSIHSPGSGVGTLHAVLEGDEEGDEEGAGDGE